jgi:hypothetical protein
MIWLYDRFSIQIHSTCAYVAGGPVFVPHSPDGGGGGHFRWQGFADRAGAAPANAATTASTPATTTAGKQARRSLVI